MQSVLSPGIRLLSRFGFARKFQLLFLLFALPLAGSLWMIGQTYQAKMAVIAKEHSGVRQLLALDAVDVQLSSRRNLAARWKAVDTARVPGPEAQQAISQLDNSMPALRQSIEEFAAALSSEGASDEVQKRLQELQAAVPQLELASLRTVGWWPDALDRFTALKASLQGLRDQIAMDSGLTLEPSVEGYLLMQIATQQAPDMFERVGRLASMGEASVAAGQFSLQSRLQLRDLRGRINDARAQLDKTGATLQAKLPAQLSTWAEQYASTQQQLNSDLKALDDGLFGDTINMKAPAFQHTMDSLLKTLSDLRQQALKALDARLDFYHNRAIAQAIPVVAAFAILLLAAVYLFICLQSSIRRSASGITTLAQSLRDGNLCVEVEVQGRDELAAISTALNLAVVQLRTSLLGVNHETQQLGDAVITLNSQSTDTLGEVEAQQHQISQIATAATELAATSLGVSKSCELASASVRQTRAIAEASNRDSERTTASIQGLNQRLGETAEALGRVSDQGQQIQSVVDSIRGIAEQTNLLALNAAIEAARAGEQGRGFAVVADEVRSLSQRTQTSTLQIATTVESLRSTVRQAVELMEAACGQAQSDATAVTGLGVSLSEIASAVQGVSDTLAQIATAVEEQATTADAVSGSIQQVDQAAIRLLDGARAVNQAADRLSKGSRALNDNTARFSLG
ncbi:methyl-accepting chemotaxis protein [Pseudomonas sp. GV071]|nr:methyl-accepting chemotaxis protein [Pseudomonas sp. GV071]PTQ70497.1 methyl-accepting chemotaxis protein [Pseudomonas sp. GV071]